MILTTHALVGAAIGKSLQNPWLILIISPISHFILDSFRHGEYFDSRFATTKDASWKIILDLTIGGSIILSFLFFSHSNLNSIRNILLGSFFSMLPDLLTVLFWKFKWKILGKIKIFHSFCHRYSRFPKFSDERKWTFRNVVNDLIFSALAIIILFFIK